jgi:hypothetical protein
MTGMTGMTAMTGRRRARPVMALVAVLATAAGLASCGAPHPGVSNGSVSVCYRAIPSARSALHTSRATLIGVHRIPTDQVRSHLPAAAQAELAAESDTVVCALSFKGTFAAGQVELAPPTQQGSYAVVLVSSRHLHLVAAVVLTQLPSSLGRRTV